MAQLRQQNEAVSFQLCDYLEDVEVILQDGQNHQVIIHEGFDVKGKGSELAKEVRLKEFITTWQGKLTIRLVTEQSLENLLVKQLCHIGFYQIIPIDKLEHLLEPPQNEKELFYLFDYNEVTYGSPQEEYIHKVSRPQQETSVIESERETPSYEGIQKSTRRVLVPEKESDYQHDGENNSNDRADSITFDKAPKYEISELPGQETLSLELKGKDNSLNRPLVSVFWSPIPNVGVNTLTKALGYTLALRSRKVLIIELDTELAKLARTTSLTHTERDLYRAISALETEKEYALRDNIVNSELAMDNLSFRFKEAKSSLRYLPSNLYVLSRDSMIGYKDEPEINNDRVIDLLFYQAKQEGFQHILVDVPSSPDNLFTTLSFLYADERFAIVDESYATSGVYKNSMKALENIDFEKEDFELIINKYRDRESAEHIASFYETSPVLELPYDPDLFYQQLDLRFNGGEAYMDAIETFVTRYGLEKTKKREGKKKLALFGR